MSKKNPNNPKTKPVAKTVPKSKGGRPRMEPARIPVYDTLGQCSSATGVPISALQMAKRKGCEAFRHGRVDLAGFIRWFFANALEGGKDWTQENKRLDALLKEVDLDEAHKRVIEFAVVTQFLTNLVGFFFGELDRLGQELPPALKGKTETTIHGECVKEFEKIKGSLRKQLDAWERKGAK